MQHRTLPATLHLRDVAFTLQQGRDEMVERLALVVTSIEELRTKLSAFVDSAATDEAVFLGTLAKKDSAADSDPEATPEAVADVLGAGDKRAIARLWTLGAAIDWQDLQADAEARRVPLPTYPFAKKRYWIKMLQA